MATIETLKALGDLLAVAADSVAKLGDSIAHIISLGARGYDEVSARHVRARLKDIDARLVNVHRLPNASIHAGIEGYIARARAHHASTKTYSDSVVLRAYWNEFVSNLSIPLEQIQQLLDDVSVERSDFVLEKSYGDILSTLNSRVNIIKELMRLPCPSSPQEIEALEKVLSQYDILRSNLHKASTALADYLKKNPV